MQTENNRTQRGNHFRDPDQVSYSTDEQSATDQGTQKAIKEYKLQSQVTWIQVSRPLGLMCMTSYHLASVSTFVNRGVIAAPSSGALLRR